MHETPPSLSPIAPDKKHSSPERTAKFELNRLGKGVLIVGAIVAILGGLLMSAPQDNESFKIGNITGRLFAIILIPYFAGWLSWRLSGKRKGSGNLPLIVLGSLFVLGNIAILVSAASKKLEQAELQASALEKAQKAKQSLRQAYQDDSDLPDSQIINSFNEIIFLLEDMAARPGSNDEIIKQETIGMLSEIRQGLITYSQNLKRFEAEVSLHASDLVSQQVIADMRATIQKADASIVELLELYDNMETNIKLRFTKRGLPISEINRFLPSFDFNNIRNIANIYQLEHVYMKEADALLALLQDNWNRWEYSAEDDTVYFDDDALIEEYNYRFKKLTMLEEKAAETHVEYMRNL